MKKNILKVIACMGIFYCSHHIKAANFVRNFAQKVYACTGLFGLSNAIAISKAMSNNDNEFKEADNHESQEKQKLVIWVRRWISPAASEASKKEYFAASTSYLNSLVSELKQDPNIDPILMIISKENDPIHGVKLANFDNKNIHTIAYNNMESFSGALNTLIQETPAGIPVLTISPGIQTSPSQNSLAGFNYLLTKGLKSLAGPKPGEKKVYGYGWKIDYGNLDQLRHFAACHKDGNWCTSWTMDSYSNDGSAPGKGWYNTCALLDQKLIALLKKEPVPSCVDTGKSGKLTILNGATGKTEDVDIGGVEETFFMGVAVKADPDAVFVHNVTDSLYTGTHSGTGVTEKQKLLRKVAVAKFYEEKVINPGSPASLQQHIQII